MRCLRLRPSRSKGRDRYYAYYHCQRQCRAVNIARSGLEGLFVEELRLLQPSASYLRLVNDRILATYQQIRSEVRQRAGEADRHVHAIQKKLDHLDDAFLFTKSIDQATYERQRDKVRQDLALAQIDRHSEQLEELDVEGLLAFAERILPRSADMWVQASLDQKQKLQTLLFPDGIELNGIRFNRTGVTASVFSYLRLENGVAEGVVSPVGIEPTTNRLRAFGRARSRRRRR